MKILLFRNWHPPIPTAEHNRAAEIHQCSVNRDSNVYSCCSVSSDLASAIKCSLLPSRKDLCRLRESDERLITPRIMLMSQMKIFAIGTILDSTCFSWNQSEVSLLLSIVLHLLLAPVGTVVKPAEHEVAHRPSPSSEAVSRCSPQNRKSTL